MNALTVTQINRFPIKSMGKLSTQHANIRLSGLAFDRRFMLVDQHNKMVTARQQAILFQVTVSQESDGVFTITHEKMPTALVLNRTEFALAPVSTHVWDDECKAFSTTETANHWFSTLLGESVSLVYSGDEPKRHHPKLGKDINLADDYPILLATTGSLAALNARSQQAHEMDQFRPNIVVDCDAPFAEETWQRIRIGEVIFEKGPACGRCQLTQRDPNTGKAFDTAEPLSVLAKFRSDENGDVYFGQFFAPVTEGVIKTGDVVEVLETTDAPVYQPDADNTLYLRCTQKENIAQDFSTFTFVAEQGKALPNFKAGQYVGVTVNVEGKAHTRYYTLSSSPEQKNAYQISVKAIDGGLVSKWFNDTCQVGQILAFEPPQGDFHLTSSECPILLLSAGSGITPMLSMIRTLVTTQSQRRIVFYHQARTESDLPYLSELQAYAKQRNVQLHLVLTQPSEQWQGEVGRLTSAHLSQLGDLSQFEVFVCGPDGFMKTAKALTSELGVLESNHHQESFGTADSITDDVSPVQFSINQATFMGDNQENILKQAELNQITIPSGCRAGLCGKCKVTVVSGEVDQKPTTALSEDDRAEGKVLACCCRALSDIEIAF